MDIFQIVALGLVATILSLLVKEDRPEFGVYIALVTGIIIFIFVATKLQAILDVLNQMITRINIDNIYYSTLFKIIGIAYITEFGAQACRDAGEKVIASKIEFAGKIFIMVMAVPILISLMDLMINMVP
ncbi:MAG: stage III sporulation protein AD [Alkaliphilus sp.]|nr:MAG: stage III sporulation protein AD [Alkaliphilus sp.]